MWFLGAGVLLGMLWLADIGPVGQLHWGWILLPFGLAAAWWAVADATGYTQRTAVRRMDERKAARRDRDMAALGLDVRRESRVRTMREGTRRNASAAPPAAPPAPPRSDPRP